MPLLFDRINVRLFGCQTFKSALRDLNTKKNNGVFQSKSEHAACLILAKKMEINYLKKAKAAFDQFEKSLIVASEINPHAESPVTK